MFDWDSRAPNNSGGVGSANGEAMNGVSYCNQSEYVGVGALRVWAHVVGKMMVLSARRASTVGRRV